MLHPWVGKVSLKEEMASHSSIPSWEIPWTEELGGIKSMGLQKNWTHLVTKHPHITLPKQDNTYRSKWEHSLQKIQKIIKINMLSERSQTHTHTDSILGKILKKKYLFWCQKTVFPGLGGRRLNGEQGRMTKEPKDSFELDRYARHVD